MDIVREVADGVSTSVLAERFGVTPRAVQYTVKSDEERQRDTAVPVLAVSVKVTPEEMAAFDAVLASAGIETRSEGLSFDASGRWHLCCGRPIGGRDGALPRLFE